MPKQGKGSAFERWLCRELSLWWTRDLPKPRDDVFWRTPNSGGRATTRAKKGKQTKNHYGDVMAVDPIGQPLMDFCVIEAKKGYNSSTVGDLIDKPEKAKPQQYERWIAKAEEDKAAAGSDTWMLIHKRDRREAVVVLSGGCEFWDGEQMRTFEWNNNREIWFAPFSNFLQAVKPKDIENHVKWLQDELVFVHATQGLNPGETIAL